jgi:hypothetical protein
VGKKESFLKKLLVPQLAKISTPVYGSRGTRCWRNCATSREVAGSIPHAVIWIFHWNNPSGRTMALGSTQRLREMSTRNISFAGWRWPVRRVDNLTTIICRLYWNSGSLNLLEPSEPVQPCSGIALRFYGTRTFITAFTTANHLSVPWAIRIRPTSVFGFPPRVSAMSEAVLTLYNKRIRVFWALILRLWLCGSLRYFLNISIWMPICTV